MRLNVFLNLILIFQLLSPKAWGSNRCIDLFKDTKSSLFQPPQAPTPKSSQQGFLNMENQRMYYRLDVPSGLVHKAKDEVFLLIHGLLAHSGYLDGVAEKLITAGKTVLRVDLLGHGRSLLNSSQPAGTIHDQAKAISQILYHLSISNLTIYGHSLGGGIAIQTVLTAPDYLNGRLKINRLIIDEPYIYPVDKWIVEQTGNNMMTAQAFNPFTYVDYFVGTAAGTDSVRGTFAKGFAGAIRQNPKYFALTDLSAEDQALGAVAVFPTEDLRPLAAQIEIPVTLIRGRFDARVAPKSLMDAIPGFFSHPVKVKEVKSPVQHHQPFESPDSVANIILDLD